MHELVCHKDGNPWIQIPVPFKKGKWFLLELDEYHRFMNQFFDLNNHKSLICYDLGKEKSKC